MGDVIIDGLTGANRLVILDANGKIPALDGSNVTLLAGANFSTGTIPVARIDTGTAAGKVVKLDGNAKLPAVSGAALTGVAGATKNASNPVIATNPSGGVGTEWQNTTTGEIFICTDATAGANVWTSTGGRSGDITPPYFPGENYGYQVGGLNSSVSAAASTQVARFSFTSDGNATDVADPATSVRYMASTNSYELAGYTMAGHHVSPNTNVLDIQKLVFATNANMTDVGDMSANCQGAVGVASSTHGYGMYVGNGGSPSPGSAPYSNVIEKFSFSTEGNTTDVGDMPTWTYANTATGNSSSTHGYSGGGGGNTSGGPGNTWVTVWDTIWKMAYSSDSNAVDAGNDYLNYLSNQANASSTTYGYALGGRTAPGNTAMNTIQKFPFASSANATDVGDLTVNGNMACGTSSLTYAYRAAGYDPYTDVIAKVSFATDGNSTDVGNLPTQQGYGGGSFHF